jgi:hypothetical protein
MDNAVGSVFGWFKQEQEIDGEKQEMWFNVTSRSQESVEDAIDKYFGAVVHTMTTYNASPYKPAGSPQPKFAIGEQAIQAVPGATTTPPGAQVTYVDVDDSGSELEEHVVSGWAHCISKSKGSSYMRIYGAGLGEYGQPVWNNMIPKDVMVQVNGQPVKLSEGYKYFATDIVQPIPPQMAIALTRGSGRDMSVRGFKRGAQQ